MRDGVVSPHTRPASRLRFPPLARHGLDVGIKPCIAQRLMLIQRPPYGAGRRFVQLRPEPSPVGSLPFPHLPTERQLQRMRGEVRVDLTQGIVAVARPAVMRRISDHGRPVRD